MSCSALRSNLLRVGLTVLAVMALTGYGCEATQGSVEFHNATDHEILWVTTTPELLPEVFGASSTRASIGPGKRSVQSMGTEAWEPEWCQASGVVHYLLRPLDGQAIGNNGRSSLGIELSEFEIVAERGPGFCWGEKHATWVFDG